jgi:hypothetical protein
VQVKTRQIHILRAQTGVKPGYYQPQTLKMLRFYPLLATRIVKFFKSLMFEVLNHRRSGRAAARELRINLIISVYICSQAM